MKKISNRTRNVFFILISILFTNLTLSCTAQSEDFPYELKKMDYALIPVGIGLKYLSAYCVDNLETMPLANIGELNRADVNAFDRSATRRFSTNYDDISDRLRTTLVILPSAIIGHQLIKKEWANTLTYGAIYFETYLFTVGITDMTKAIAKRKRPYLYNDKLSAEERYEYTSERDSYGSFFSGHTSAVFAAAVCLSKTYTDIYGKSTWSKVIWGTTLTAASVAGYCRYASGEHYPSDVIAGALVGGAIGYLIPTLHKKTFNDRFTTSVGPKSIYLSYTF